MAQCSDCVCYRLLDATKGECHYAPPVPEGEYPYCHSEWPIVLAGDLCGQYSAGAHTGNTCDTCAYYTPLPVTDPGACHNPDRPEANDSICADAECIAIPPTPVGEYRGDLSAWPRVMDDDWTCCSCWSRGDEQGGPL